MSGFLDDLIVTRPSTGRRYLAQAEGSAQGLAPGTMLLSSLRVRTKERADISSSVFLGEWFILSDEDRINKSNRGKHTVPHGQTVGIQKQNQNSSLIAALEVAATASSDSEEVRAARGPDLGWP